MKYPGVDPALLAALEGSYTEQRTDFLRLVLKVAHEMYEFVDNDYMMMAPVLYQTLDRVYQRTKTDASVLATLALIEVIRCQHGHGYSTEDLS